MLCVYEQALLEHSLAHLFHTEAQVCGTQDTRKYRHLLEAANTTIIMTCLVSSRPGRVVCDGCSSRGAHRG